MKQKDHQGAADELFASMNNDEENRRKRQAGFNDDYGSDVYGKNPQYDSPNGFGDGGGRRGPFGFNGRHGRQGPPPQFGPDPNDNGPFVPRQGPLFGPWGDRQGPLPPPFGPPRNDDRQGSDERRGRQGPPPSFGPGDEGQRGPFGPREDDRRGPFEPDERYGRQGPPPPFGPRDDDNGPSLFGPSEDKWNPFGPKGWGPFGPGRRGGRHGPPPPPPFGPGSDGRRGRQWPPRPWGPPGRRHHWHGLGGFEGFGANQENEDFNERQTSMWNIPNRGKDSRGFVYRLLHETNCVNANDTCLCCCGPYIPNVANKTCEDLRQLFPGIEDTSDALMGIEDIDQGSESLPMEPPMEELSPTPELPFEEFQVPTQMALKGPVKIPKSDHDF
uniref:Uncharacterized protein n=1 Tax=Panagrolaimus davidi TaxID=227884 RepID=A0A914PQU9_9BILA